MGFADTGIVYASKRKLGVHVVQVEVVDDGSARARLTNDAVGPGLCVAQHVEHKRLWSSIDPSQSLFGRTVGKHG